jgi:hypothetical protein
MLKPADSRWGGLGGLGPRGEQDEPPLHGEASSSLPGTHVDPSLHDESTSSSGGTQVLPCMHSDGSFPPKRYGGGFIPGMVLIPRSRILGITPPLSLLFGREAETGSPRKEECRTNEERLPHFSCRGTSQMSPCSTVWWTYTVDPSRERRGAITPLSQSTPGGGVTA